MVLLVSNLVATKLWNLPIFNIAVDGGLMIFPLSYIIGDMIVEIYGKKMANRAVMISMMMNLVAMAVFVVVGMLPGYPGWEGQEAYETILGFAPRIMVASLLGYVLSGWVNNHVFIKIKDKQKAGKTGRGYRVRAIVSSLPARLVDNLTFETLAFIGVLPFSEFLAQMTGAFVEGVIVEALIGVTISPVVLKMIRRYLSKDGK